MKENWNSECALSAEKENLVMHHFYSGARSVNNKDLRIRDALLYHSSNGILLHKAFHLNFHKEFGYTENTIVQFQKYVETLKMSISSQAQQECWEGSETRVNDLSLLPPLQLEKIMKLHERLEEIKQTLASVLNFYSEN